MLFWNKTDECSECPVIKNQLADLLDEINSLQANLQTVRHERDVYQESCITSRTDLRTGNTKFFEQKQQINELTEKVRLYQEANQTLFEKCATVNDLEGEVRTLKMRIHDLEVINWRGGGGGRPAGDLLDKDAQTENQHEPHAEYDGTHDSGPSRETALKHLSRHLQELSDFSRPLSFSTSTTPS